MRFRKALEISGSMVWVRMASIMRPPDSSSVQRRDDQIEDVVAVGELGAVGGATRFWIARAGAC
jgi:hypothetical protein